MSDVQRRNREVLDAIQIRRDDFYEALLALEQALAAPAGDRPSDWAASLREPVEQLRRVLEAHVSGTEGEGGFFAEIREHAPRLIHAMDRLQAEHDPLRDAAAALAASLDAVTSDADVDGVRETGVELIRRLLVHRHRGAELVYDAYWVDLSAGD
ncbi:MAG: hypothetical protein MUP97_14205 [Acidimicrobiia bacterium]|jgi:hypothetical protein|nr:hypothetical protein [Acidimicrobiia bacterium]